MARIGIKGSVKMTLHNVHNGKNEIITGNNTVTYAVRDLFANNILGGLDNSKFTPLWSNFFGGVLAYKTAHPLVNGALDPSDYFPQANSANNLIAHAGDQSPASAVIAQEDFQRGSPASRIITDGVIKQTWEWTPSQGNGLIAALALTHKDVGNAGLGNGSSTFKAFSPFLVVSGAQLSNITASLSGEGNVFAKYDDNHGLAFYIGEDGEYKAGKTKFETTKVSVYVKLIGYKRYALFESVDATNINVRKFTVNTSVTFFMQPAYYFDATNKRLWLFTNATSTSTRSKQTIYYTVIDCENGTEYAHGSFVSDNSNFAPVCQDRTAGNGYNEPRFTNIVMKDGCFFFPTTDQSTWNYNDMTVNAYSGFKKINISTPSDQTQIDANEDFYYASSGLAGGGLNIYDGLVINGNDAFVCAHSWDAIDSVLLNTGDGISSFAMPMQNGDSVPRRIVANKMVNTTKFNLPSPVTKTASQSMIIEYTLEEVTSP